MWFDLPSELRHLRSEAQKDYSDMVARSPQMVTPIVQAIYKLGQFEYQMLIEQGELEQAQGIISFCDRIKRLATG